MDAFIKSRTDTELEEKDIDKAKNVGFRVCDQGVVTYEQKTSSVYLAIVISVMFWLVVFIQGR